MRYLRWFRDRWVTQLSSQTVCLTISGCLALTTYAAPQPNSTAAEGGPRYKSSQTSSPLGDFTETGAPRSRGSAGSRGSCPVPDQDPSPAVALVPLAQGTVNDQIVNVPFGETISSHPHFWFKFAQDPGVIERLDFTLIDEATQDLVKEIRDISQLKSASLPDIWGVQWPTKEEELKTNHLYRWFLVIECRGTEGSGLLLSGLIKRKELPPTLANQLPQATTSRERAFLYANNGIWHDAATELYQGLQADPNSPVLQSDWNTLLESINL